MVARERSKPREVEPTEKELEQGLQIDKNQLDDECASQPEMFHRVAQRLEMAISRRDEAKQDLQEEEARADERVRNFLEQTGGKVTEAEVKSQITLDPKVREAKRQLNALNLEVGQLTASKESYKQRGYALGHLVDLYVSAYFGDTSRIERKARVAEGEQVKNTRERAVYGRERSR